MEKICAGCGKPFQNNGAHRVSQARWVTRLWCSVECRKIETHTDYGKSKKCETCDKIFYRPENQRGYLWRVRRFCSTACANRRQTRTKRTKSCEVCGKQYLVKGNVSQSHTCSRECGGIALSTQTTGNGHWNWKGGRVVTKQGYVRIHVSKDYRYRSAGTSNYMLEHQMIMAEHLGRLLMPWEQVHHINGIRDDNRIENLQLRSGAHGSGIALKCLDCGSINVGSVKI